MQGFSSAIALIRLANLQSKAFSAHLKISEDSAGNQPPFASDKRSCGLVAQEQDDEDRPGSDFSTAEVIFTFAAVSAVLLDLNDTRCFSLWRKKDVLAELWTSIGKALEKRRSTLWPTVKDSEVGPMAFHPTSRKP